MQTMEMSKVRRITRGAISTVGNVLEILASASGKLDPLTRLPLVGDTISDIQDAVCMLNDYFNGSYKNIPTKVLLGCGLIVVYTALPFDIIPDNIPVLGFVDDAFVIKLIMSTCISKELDTYRLWRAQQAE